MSKVELPDQVLDAVAGGKVTIQGQVVKSFDVEEDRYLVTTESGDQFAMPFREDESDFAKSYFKVSAEARMQSDETHALNPDSFKKI